MAIEARASFPQLSSSNTDGTFAFPEKFHEIPVLYACAMYQSSESSISEKNSYLSQFNEGLKSFIENYDVPVAYRDDSNTEHFTSTAGQTTFTITKRGYSYRTNLKVYLNGVETTSFEKSENSFILFSTPTTGTQVTAIWEDRPDLQEPPYPWWKGW